MSTAPGRDRVRALLDLGRPQEAVTLATTLLAGNPTDIGLLGLLAQGYLATGNAERALGVAGRMVSASPDAEWGHRLRAIALNEMGSHDWAESAASVAVRLAPHEWRCHQAYATVASAQKKTQTSAWAAAQRAVTLAPHQPEAHFAAGLVAQRMRKPAQARDAYEAALALQPTHVGALNNLTLLRDGLRLAPAVRAFGSALQIDPQSATARGNVDRLVERFVFRLRTVSLCCMMAALVVIAFVPGLGTAVNLTHTTLAAAVVLVPVAYLWSVRRRIPAGLREYARAKLLRKPLRGRLIETAFITAGISLLCLFVGPDDVDHSLVAVLAGLYVFAIMLHLVQNGVGRIRRRG